MRPMSRRPSPAASLASAASLLIASVAVAFTVQLPAQAPAAAAARDPKGPVPEVLFDAFEWRLVGPFRGGRVAAVCGIASDRNTYYFGATGGGVWKTTDAGKTW